MTTTTKRFVSLKLILSDDANKNYSHVVRSCVFDPNTPVNILGVTTLGTFFGDSEYATDPLVEDGTTIELGATKSQFIWDHGRHERHFMDGCIQNIELYLYVGHRYFTYFCTILHKLLV